MGTSLELRVRAESRDAAGRPRTECFAKSIDWPRSSAATTRRASFAAGRPRLDTEPGLAGAFRSPASVRPLDRSSGQGVRPQGRGADAALVALRVQGRVPTPAENAATKPS